MYSQNFSFIDMPYYDSGSPIGLICTTIALIVGTLSIFLNILAVIAISRIRGSLPVNIRLVCCLVGFDILVSIVVIIETSISMIHHTMTINFTKLVLETDGIHYNPLHYHECLSLILHILRFAGYNGTLLSLTALATDLYVAIMYPLNYSSLMRKDRVNFIIIFIFVIALFLASLVLYFPFLAKKEIPLSDNRKYCFKRWQSQGKSSFATFGIVIISVIVVSLVYITVFYQIRNFHKNGVRCVVHTHKPSPASNNANNADKTKNYVIRGSSNCSNLKKNQRGLTTTLVLLLAFLSCFLPSFIVEVYLMIAANNKHGGYQHDISLTKIMMNLPLICSALDPLLYSYRLKDIQISYLRLFCCYRDDRKPNLPPLVAGRARPHPTVPVYQPVHRRSIACTSPNSNIKQSAPWSQRLANATGIYIERIRKISGRHSSVVTISHKRTPISAPPFNRDMDYDTNNEALIPDKISNNPCYSVPAEYSMVSGNFISPPKMVLSTWHFANKSLRESWLMDQPITSKEETKKSINLFSKKQKLSSYSSFECAQCSGHSGSIDSNNTNSTGTAGSYNQTRSQSFDHVKDKSVKMKNKLIDLPNQILE